MHRLTQLWSSLRSSFWFMPTLIVAASVALAIALVATDSAGSDRWLAQWPRLFGATPEGARQLLATIAGSMMTVMGVTFSMTLVALSLASSQYTSRILRTFMRSRVTQSTLGIFAGIFAYCLIVLHTVRSGVAETVFVPSLALFFAFVLALSGVGVLIYFIHHIASSIQASSIIASVAEETIAAIDRLLPEKLGHASADDMDQVPQSLDEQSLDERTWNPVPAKTDGYIQNADSAALMRLAQEKKVVLRMERGVGEFVVQDTALASLTLEVPPDQETMDALNAAYSISSHRTVEQDLAFGLSQIVDMALKALSPGVNETSTAVMCVDYLTAILARLATRKFPPSRRYQEDELRVIALAPTFESLLSSAFDQIRRSAKGNVSVMSRMLGAIDVIASQTDSPAPPTGTGRTGATDCRAGRAHHRLGSRSCTAGGTAAPCAQSTRGSACCARRRREKMRRMKSNREVASQTPLKNFGAVVSVRGSVVDVRFDGRLPSIYSVLRTGEEKQIVIEVLAQRDAHHVRGIALTPTQGLARGMTVEDTGGPLKAPVGKGFGRECWTCLATSSTAKRLCPMSSGAPFIELRRHSPGVRPSLRSSRRASRSSMCWYRSSAAARRDCSAGRASARRCCSPR